MTTYALYLCLQCSLGCQKFDEYSSLKECMYYAIVIKTLNPVERLCLPVPADD